MRVSERGSSLAGLYGLACVVRVSCTVVVGIGGEFVEQSIYESEFPPSTASAVPLPPKGTAFSRLLLRSRLQISTTYDTR